MTNSSSSYIPPKVWTWQKKDDNQFANINRPISGSTHQQELPVGKHPLQLYSLATPNGVKVTVMLEELLELGIKEAEYDAYPIKIMEGQQFGSDFVEVNPNSKIPAMVDRSGKEPLYLFESGAILLYLAEKFDVLLPKEQPVRAQCLSWLFWQMGSAPILGGGFGHFYAYAEEKLPYPIDRFTMEIKRQLDVLDRHLEQNQYFCSDTYTIADIAIAPWYGALSKGQLYDAGEFLDVASYKHVNRWADQLFNRDAFKRGAAVNRTWGDEDKQLPERHSANDFDGLNL